MRPPLITLEGTEGVGKSTALGVITHYLEEKGIDFLATREPGGTQVGEAIRGILLAHRDEKISPLTELFLMFAARTQHVDTCIMPALNAGKWVVSDRFTDASFAYQGGGREIEIDKINTLAEWTHPNLMPDFTILLDAPLEVAMARVAKRGQADRIEAEKEAFFERVRAMYLARAKADPNRFYIIDASLPLADVEQAIVAAMEILMNRLGFKSHE